MKVLICLVALTLCACRTASAQSGQAGPAQRPRPGLSELVKMPAVYSVPGMNRVAVRSDLKYTSAGEPHLLMDVYVPPRLRRGERRPAVIFIHGSVPPGSRAKDMGVFKSWGRLAAASGMVGVTFTHRLGFPQPRLTQAAGDVRAAIEYVRANAASLNVDEDRLCLAAYSGGGPMLSIALRERPPYVRCLVAFYAFMDIQQSDMHRPHELPDALTSFSPITYLTGDTAGLPPMFVARAGLDEVPGLNDSIDRFAREALGRNAPVTLFNHPRGVHAFDLLTDDDRSREIIRAALAFMETHLRRGAAG